MRIAITGANSRIGQSVKIIFSEAGHEVISLVRQPITKNEINFDLSLPVHSAILESIDIVIHIAWDRSRNYQHSLNVNRMGGLNLLDACAKAGAKPVLLSTMSVHAPLSEYGKTKALLEDRVLELAGQVVRSGLIWGQEISGFLSTVNRIAKIPLINPCLRPDPDLFHSEVTILAQWIMQVSLSNNKSQVTSAIAKESVKLSSLIDAMRVSKGLKIGVSTKAVHRVVRRLEALGMKLPFNSDSIGGILEGFTFDEVDQSTLEDNEFPNSQKFLEWAANL